MAKTENVTQCKMQSGNSWYTAWIPQKFAVRGKVLTINTMPGHWLVIDVYSSMEIGEANERSQDFAHHREFSDV